MFIPVKGFAPDSDPTEPGILTDCDLLIPSLRGMQALPQDVDAGISAAPSAIASIQSFRLMDGTTRVIAGSEGSASAAVSKLYELSSINWSDQSGGSGSYTATSQARWVFCNYNDTIYAAQKGTGIQKSPSADFTVITGAPQALVIENVLDFVMAFNTTEATYGDSPNRWWCCAKGNPDSWTADIATQANTGLLTDTSGAILAAKRIGSSMAAFKNTSMYLGQYVGTPQVWRWDLIPGEGLGTWSPYSVVDVEGIGLLFIGYDNIYSFDGSRAQPIGTNRVAQFLFDNMDIDNANLIVGFHHRQAWRVYWWFPSINGNATLDKFLCYNYRSDRWGYGAKTVKFAFEYLEPGITYNDVGTYYSTYDSIPTSAYDALFASAGTFKPAVLDSSNLIQKLEGDGNNSTLTTGVMGKDGVVTMLSRVRPRFSTAPSTGTQAHIYRDTLGSAGATSIASTTLQRGAFDHVWSARWHQLAHSYTGSMELMGLDVEWQDDSLE